jgi:hypothetical protein
MGWAGVGLVTGAAGSEATGTVLGGLSLPATAEPYFTFNWQGSKHTPKQMSD